MSLRFNVSSTIRDDHVTVPQPVPELRSTSLWQRSSPYWTDISRLCGRVYDEFLSPSAQQLPSTTRASRGKALALEVEKTLMIPMRATVCPRRAEPQLCPLVPMRRPCMLVFIC